MRENMTLRELPIGKTATIKSVGGEGALRQHFLDMGLIPQGDVTMVKYAPMGDPMELRIHSYELTLRLADAEKIEIENIRDAKMIPPMPDPDAELRKIAVTAYMSRMKRENVSFVYDNLDKILETYYGQKTSVDEAFKDIGGMLLNGRGDDGSGTGNEIFLAVGSGLAGAADFAL